MISYLLVPIFAVILGLGFTHVVKRLAPRFRLVDAPDGHRKTHRGPIALGGGLAVLLAGLLAAAAAAAFDPALRQALAERPDYALGLAVAAVLMVAVGLWDDAVGLRGRQKVLGQIGICLLLILVADLKIMNVVLFGSRFDLGVLALPFTLFWLLGTVNAINLLDGMDGLCGTIGVVTATAIAVLAIGTGMALDAIVLLALAGGLVGFLRHNWPPASIFLGDAGSMLVGLVLGTCTIHASTKTSATMALFVPVALLTVPILDSLAAVVRRKLTGRSIYNTDRGHLHHCLMQRNRYGARQTLYRIGALCVFTSTGGVLATCLRQEWLAVATVLTAAVWLVGAGWFGNAEVNLLRSRLGNFAKSLVPGLVPVDAATGRHASVRIQGDRNWEDLWEELLAVARPSPLVRLCLDLNLPYLHEGWHARWDRAAGVDRDGCVSVQLPLSYDRKRIGRLEMLAPSGDDGDENAKAMIGAVMRLMATLDARLPELTVQATTMPAATSASLEVADSRQVAAGLDLADQVEVKRPEDGRLTIVPVPAFSG